MRHGLLWTRLVSFVRCRAIPSRRLLLQASVLLTVAILTRSAHLGDPTIGDDEQFYLLVGDRIWQGALPFVDIWDRKPIGLFLLYALFRPFSFDGIIAYQVAALLFAAATAFVLARIATRVAGAVAATVAGALYLVYLPIISGVGGQSPVFYNLFTASAALLVVRTTEETSRSKMWRNGLVAMLLVGLAIQVKYTALFEGMAFGLWLLWLYWRMRGALIALAAYAIALVGAALFPTALALSCYAIGGHGSAFFAANFLSIFQKSEPAGFSAAGTFLVTSAIKMSPILLLAIIAMIRVFPRRQDSPTLILAMLWGTFAFAECLMIGVYYDHYAIPLLMPLSIVVASCLDWTPFALAVPSIVICMAILFPKGFSRTWTLQDEARITALTEALSPYARKGCIYIYDGPSILYLTTHSCLPTSYAFPSHLSDADEARATDATASMTKVLRRFPPAIALGDRPRLNPRNADTYALLGRALAADYHLEKTLPDVRSRNVLIYVRNDLIEAP